MIYSIILNLFKIKYPSHKLVALTFLYPTDGNIKNKVVNHIDENKQNNSVENLEWLSHTENIAHSCGKKICQID